VTIRGRDGELLDEIGESTDGDASPCDPGRFLAAHAVWSAANGSVYVSEVINARANVGPGAVPLTCHALQVFRPT
jgi:hypothetical protein